MKKFEKILDTGMRFIMAVFMLALVVGGTWQIVTKLAGSPSTVTDEFLRYVLIWASLIGSAYCFYRDEHLTLDLLTDRAKGPAKIALTVFIEAMILFFVCYVFIYGGWKLTVNATNSSAVTRIPFKFLYSIVPISGVFIVVARILKYIQLFVSKDSKGSEDSREEEGGEE